MRRTVLCLLVVVNVGALLCQAQVGPLVAKRHVVRDVLDSEGNVVRHSETFGRYLRNSAGSTIDQEYSLQGGKLAVESGQLRDYSRHKIFELIYENHEAVELADLPGEPHPEYLADAKSASGQETINGIPCLIHSIYMIVDGKKRLIGKGYDSAEYGVPVREDALIEPPGGPRTHQIVELYDFQTVEPDPKEFDLEDFSFVAKRPAACAKPGASAAVAEPLK
ncbi:MAG: hypothetical protein ABR874_08390 [Candidatus Sulfotelmatobacter sp.]